MPVDRSKPLKLCPLFCHETRPQDGLFGELKQMIDEGMPLVRAVALHIRNWNFTASQREGEQAEKVGFAHEICHLLLGMAIYRDPALHRLSPFSYNGQMLYEYFVTQAEEFLMDAAKGILSSPKFMKRKITHFAEHNLSVAAHYSDIRLEKAWFLSAAPGREADVFEVRRAYGFDRDAIDAACEEKGYSPSAVLKKAADNQTIYQRVYKPSASEINSIVDGMVPSLRTLCKKVIASGQGGGIDGLSANDIIRDALRDVRLCDLFPEKVQASIARACRP